MGSLRNKTIVEILNYERGMNKIILDRTIEQAKLLNESRNPPGNRDIKFEALIGELVNKLKQTIEEASAAIKNTQFEKLGLGEIKEAMDFPTGAVPDNSEIESGSEYSTSEGEWQSGPTKMTPANAPIQGPKLKAAGRKMSKALQSQKAKPNRRKGGGESDEEEEDNKENKKESREKLEELKSSASNIEEIEKKIYTIVSEYNGIISKILEATQPQGKFATRQSVTQTNIQFLGQIIRDIEQPLRQLAYELSSSEYPEVQNYFNLISNFVQVVQTSPPFQKINFDAYKHAKIDFQGMNQALVVNEASYIAEVKSYGRRLSYSLAKLYKQQQAFNFNNSIRNVNIKMFTEGNKVLDDKIRDTENLLRKVTEEVQLVNTRPPLSAEQKTNALRALERQLQVTETALLPPILSQYTVESANPRPEARYQPYVEMKVTPSVFQDRGDTQQPERPKMSEQQKEAVGKKIEVMERELNGPLAEYGLDSIEDVDELSPGEAINVLIAEFGRGAVRAKKLDDARVREILKDIVEGVKSTDEYSAFFHGKQLSAPAPAPAPLLLEDGPVPTQPKLVITPLGEKVLSQVAPIEKIPKKNLGPLGVAPPKPQPVLQLTDGLEGMKGNALKAYAKSKIPNFKVTNSDKGGRKSDAAIRTELRALGISGSGRRKKGGSGGLADLLSTKEQQQHNRMGVPVSDDQAIQAEMIALAKRFQELSNPIHSTNIGKLYPFYEKDPATKYIFADMLRNTNSQKHPRKNALGADYSLLQGSIGGPTEYPKQPKKPSKRKVVTAAEATQNILEGRGRKKNPKALHKLKFNDEKNEMFD